MKQQFLKDQAGTISLTVYQDNRPVIPSSATIVLSTPSGGDLQASVSVTAIDATTGEMKYTITSTHTATKDLNYKAVWSYVVSGTTFTQVQLFDVVLSILNISITDEDLYDELNSLRDAQIQDTSTATAGAAGTLTDTVQRKEIDDFWTGGTIQTISGLGANQIRDISDFVQSTGVISVSPNWSTNPDNTTVYTIIRSWTKQISRSFEKIETMLLNRGKRHSLILESSELKIPHIFLCVHFIALDLMNEETDKWSRIAESYLKSFDSSFSSMKLQYDEDESGTIEGEEEGFGISSLFVGRA